MRLRFGLGIASVFFARCFGLRLLTVALLAASFAAVDGPWIKSEAHAQGFFERLFGGSQVRRAPRNRAPSRRLPRARSTPLWQPNGVLRGPTFGPPAGSNARSSSRRRRGGRYRTMCVRMCDGYFFPVSFSARRKDFRRDASVCSQRCPDQGKLFFVSSPRGQLRHARSRDGQVYRKLKTAFRYRKERVKNCACRPEPWEHSERLRHAMYSAKTGAVGGPQVIAGNYPKPKKPKGEEASSGEGPAPTEAQSGDPADSEATNVAAADQPPNDVDEPELTAQSASAGPPAVTAPSNSAARVRPQNRTPRAQRLLNARTPVTRRRASAPRRQRKQRQRDVQRTRRATVFPFFSGQSNRRLRFPGD